MCIIVDANLAALVFCTPPNNNFLPIIEWLLSPRENGRLVVGGQLAHELDKVNAARRLVKSLQQAGRARLIPETSTQEEGEHVCDTCESNDPHVIALARLSGARILCSRDIKLHRDFRNEALVSNPRGHIYQSARHSHLLRLYGHTEACRKSTNKKILM